MAHRFKVIHKIIMAVIGHFCSLALILALVCIELFLIIVGAEALCAGMTPGLAA